MPVKEVPDGGLKQELERAGDKLVLVDFFATWCGPCQKVAPTIEKFSKTYANAVFLKVDVDESQDEAQQYKISAMPTFVFFRRSKELDRVRGADTGAIEKTLTKYYKETSAFGGEGHSMLDANTAESATNAKPSIAESDRSRLEKIAQERFGDVKGGETMTTLRLRLPDMATPINIRLGTSRTLNEVRHLICDTIPVYETNPFEFMEPPAGEISLDNENKSIKDAKLMNAILTIKKI